jgi:DNA repair photolyase
MIGITECGDAGLDFSWVEQMPTMDFAILITKNVNDKFIKEVVKVKEKVIVHATITGMGGTVVEPRVPPVSISIGQLKRLINAGFPASQIVLRVDPIIPTPKGIRTATSVLDAAEGLGIKRCRVSILDMYNHVKARFRNANIPIPEYDLQQAYKDVFEALKPYMNRWDFEACAENFPFQTGCISQRDADILGSNVVLMGNKGQRKGCLCPRNKSEMLTHKSQCQHGCLYCYWSKDYNSN